MCVACGGTTTLRVVVTRVATASIQFRNELEEEERKKGGKGVHANVVVAKNEAAAHRFNFCCLSAGRRMTVLGGVNKTLLGSFNHMHTAVFSLFDLESPETRPFLLSAHLNGGPTFFLDHQHLEKRRRRRLCSCHYGSLYIDCVGGVYVLGWTI